MHPWKPWIVLASLAAFAGQAAVVYKWTDSDGVIHFSDQPVPGAEKIFTASGSSTGGSASSARQANPVAPSPPRNAAPGLNYTRFSITSPVPDQTFFGDDVISAHLAMDPSLKPGQTVTWHLNGKPLDDQPPTATQITLPHLNRGTYAIAATVTDSATGESLSTDSVNFFVRQPSELEPQHKKP
jgi:hypothetical protein